MREGFIGFRRRRFRVTFMHARLSFDQRIIWHDDEFLADVKIGIGTHVAVNPRALRIEDVLQLVADAFTDDKADNCPICAIDEHVVDYAEQSSALRHHFVTDDVRHARQVIELSQFLHRRSTHSHRIRPDRMHSGSGNHSPLSASADNGFAMHDNKASDTLAVTLHDDFLDFSEPLRRFHVDDRTSD